MKRLSCFVVTVIAVMLLSVTVNAASMRYDNGSLTIKNAPAGALLIHARYDDNGVLKAVSLEDAANETKSISAENGDKLFLWAGMNSINPLCKAIEIGTYNGELTDEAETTPDATSSATQTQESPIPETTPTTTPSSDKKMLVVYFSRAGENYSVGTIDKGNTSYIADYITEQTGADVFEIVPVNPYPQGYEDTKTRATNERNSNARHEYVGEVENFEQYDVVFIGHPIWWGDMPMIMYTFLENHNFDGKTVCQFNTHEGSGNAGTAATIKSKLPNATVTDYLAVRGSAAQKNDAALKTTIDSWLKKLGYTE